MRGSWWYVPALVGRGRQAWRGAGQHGCHVAVSGTTPCSRTPLASSSGGLLRRLPVRLRCAPRACDARRRARRGAASGRSDFTTQREHSALRCSRAQPRTAHPRAGPASPGCARAPPSALQARAASVCWFAVHAHAAAGTPQSPRCCPPVSRYALVVPSWACLRTPFGRRWSPVLQWLTGALQVPAPTTWPTPSAPPSAPRRCR